MTKTLGKILLKKIINDILYPTVAIQEGFLNRRTIKGQIPSQIWRGLQTCQEKGIQCIPGNEIRLPNCTSAKCSIENISVMPKCMNGWQNFHSRI